MHLEIHFPQMFLRVLTILNFCEMSPDVFRQFNNGRGDFVWGNAWNVMTYHRDKMNEYLCKNYIANEIVQGFKNATSENLNKRNGRPQRSAAKARESLLEDQGSKKYKDWLARSSTLEDIYHQFEHGEEQGMEHEEYEMGDHHEFDHGEDMTAYALLDTKHVYAKPVEIEESYHTVYHHHEEEKEDDKGIKLKELFHFALTSIAFLAFATFMIEVIMSVMEANSNADYVLVPTTTGGTGPGTKKTEEEVPEVKRRERSVVMDPVSLETLNIISSKVLSSIESLALIHEDDGECFQRSLCQNSKYSKTLSGPKKIWLPLWSFGISWIGSRFSRNATQAGDMSALKYLKAALTGLGNEECHVLHPKCDDRRRRRNRKKSRQ